MILLVGISVSREHSRCKNNSIRKAPTRIYGDSLLSMFPYILGGNNDKSMLSTKHPRGPKKLS